MLFLERHLHWYLMGVMMSCPYRSDHVVLKGSFWGTTMCITQSFCTYHLDPVCLCSPSRQCNCSLDVPHVSQGFLSSTHSIPCRLLLADHSSHRVWSLCLGGVCYPYSKVRHYIYLPCVVAGGDVCFFIWTRARTHAQTDWWKPTRFFLLHPSPISFCFFPPLRCFVVQSQRCHALLFVSL